MKIKRMIFGERSLTKVAALFADKSQAEDVAQRVKQVAELDDPQVYLVGPPDGAAPDSPAFSRKLEPEQRGIWRTLIRAHVIAGTVGVVAGVLVYLGFVLANSAAVKSSPGMSLVAMVFLRRVDRPAVRRFADRAARSLVRDHDRTARDPTRSLGGSHPPANAASTRSVDG